MDYILQPCQQLEIPAHEPLPIYLLQTLPMTVKRPKGWKPVCPNLPKRKYTTPSCWQLFNYFLLTVRPPVGSYANVAMSYTSTNAFATAQVVTTQSQEESTQSSINKETLVEDITTSCTTTASAIADQHQQHLQQTFVNCLAKSPELIKSEAREHFIDYDSTVKELKSNIEQCEDNRSPPSPKIMAASSATSRQSPLTLSLSSQKVKPKQVVQPVFAPRASTPVPINTQPADLDALEEPDLYKTIPVRDLISTFEKQSQPALRYNIREDMFPVQTIQKPAVNAEEKLQLEKSVPLTTFEADQPTLKQEETLPIVETFEPKCTQISEVATTPTATDDAFVQEIKTFNEVAAEFSASITSTTQTDTKGKELVTTLKLSHNLAPSINVKMYKKSVF